MKGIAILLVILVHFDQNWTAPYNILQKVSAIGARAPQFFFVISAFLTWRSIEKNGIDKSFYLNRIKRLLPTYYIALVLAMLLPTVTIGEYSIGNIVAHFLLLHGLNPYWINTILGVAWYIGDLVLFYAICPLLKKAINNLLSSLIGFVITTGLSVLALVIYNRFGTEVMGNLEMFFTTFFFIHQLPVLMMGVVLYYIIEKTRAGEVKIFRALVFLGAAIIIVLVIFLVLHLNKKILASSFIAGLLFAWIFLLSHSMRWALSIKLFTPLAFLGKHSYGIYLFHYTIITCLVLIPHAESNVLLWLLFYFLVIAISSIVSIAEEKMERCYLLKSGKENHERI